MVRHFCDDLLRREVARKLIRGREKETFDAWSVGIQITYRSGIFRGGQKSVASCESFARHEIGNLKCVEAFGDGDGDFVNAACGYRIENCESILRMVEIIFAGLQRAARAVTTESFEGVFAANHSLFCQEMGNRALRSALGDVHKNAGRLKISIRGFQGVPQPSCGGCEREN